MLAADALKNIELESMVSPASGILLIINEGDALPDEPHRKRFNSEVVQLLYLGKRIRVDILTAVAFLKTRVTKAAEKDNCKLLWVLTYLQGTSNVRWPALGIALQVFADASHAVHDDLKGYSGAIAL